MWGNLCMDMQINWPMFQLHADFTDFIFQRGGLHVTSIWWYHNIGITYLLLNRRYSSL
jgi:hypothetical protein